MVKSKKIIHQHSGIELCHNCFGSGGRRIKCRSCSGTGKFKQKSGKIVDCYRCKGTGIFKFIKCQACKGTGYIRVEEKTEIIKCWKCNGRGKIKYEPMNPVIKKGSILK